MKENKYNYYISSEIKQESKNNKDVKKQREK